MEGFIVYFLILAGSLGFILKNNFIMFVISLEIYLLAINLNFISASIKLGEATGLVVAMILLVLGALDTAIGLALLIGYYNITINADLKASTFTRLKG